MLHTIQTRRPSWILCPKMPQASCVCQRFAPGLLMSYGRYLGVHWGRSIPWHWSILLVVLRKLLDSCTDAKDSSGETLFGCSSSAKSWVVITHDGVHHSFVDMSGDHRKMTERPVLHMTCVPTYESRAWCTTGNRWGIGRTRWQQAEQVSRMCQSLFIMCTHSMDCWLTELPISWQTPSSWCFPCSKSQS